MICYQSTLGENNSGKIVTITTTPGRPKKRIEQRAGHRIGGQIPVADSRSNAVLPEGQLHFDTGVRQLEFTLPGDKCIAGCQIDLQGCVLLMSSNGHRAKLQLLRPQSWSPARELLEMEEIPNDEQVIRHVF
jgi:hypothetical protein